VAGDVIGRAVLEITADNKQLINALLEINKKTDETGEHVKNLNQLFTAEKIKDFGKFALDSILKVGAGIVELGVRGDLVEDVGNAFDNLTARVGVTAEEMLGALQRGTLGTVNNFELMKLANGSLGAGLVRSSADMQTLAEGSKLLADRMGVGTVDAFETLTKAIASGRTNHLKQYGIFVDTEGALEKYAAAHGKAKSELTMHEQAAARAAGVMSQLRGEIAENFDRTRDFGEQVDHAKAVLENFRDAVAVSINQSPVLRAGLVAVSEALEKAFGGDQKTQINAIAQIVGQLAIGMVRFGQGAVTVASYVSDGFYALRYAFAAVLEGIATVVGKVDWAVMRVAETMAKIPGQAPAFGLLAATMRKNVDEAEALAYGFRQVKEEAVKASSGPAEMLGKLNNALKTVGDAMQAASGKAVEAGQKIKTGLKPAGGEELSEAAKRSADKIAAAYAVLQAEIAAGTKLGLDKRLAELDVAQQKELEKLRALTGAHKGEYEKLATLVAQKYAQMREAAIAAGDAIERKTEEMRNVVVQATMTGMQKQLAQIDAERKKELQGLDYLKANYVARYNELAVLVGLKYKQMADAAKGENQTVNQLAAQAGLKSREELEATARKAEETYARMKASGLYTAGELVKAEEASTKAKMELHSTFAKFATDRNLEIAASASSILRTAFGKNKAAAIAATLIDAAAAIIKVFAQYGWPWGIPMAAAIAVKTGAEIGKIKSQGAQGFKTGTPGLDFASFGSVSPALLHGEEAVVPRGKGHVLASEIAAAMPKPGADRAQLHRLDRIAAGIDSLPRQMKRAFRDGLLQARA